MISQKISPKKISPKKFHQKNYFKSSFCFQDFQDIIGYIYAIGALFLSATGSCLTKIATVYFEKVRFVNY
jgi:hypothetical protein